jgi:hypothetical protein
MYDFVASAKSYMISAAVFPIIAQWSLFCTVAKKYSCYRCISIIIGGKSVDVGDLLVKPSFACPDIPYPFKELLEIISSEDSVPLFQPFIIQNKAFDHELPQNPRSPYAELRRLI